MLLQKAWGKKPLVLRFSKMPNNPLTTEQTCPKMVGKAWEDLEFLHGYMAAKRTSQQLAYRKLARLATLDAINVSELRLVPC